MYTFALAQSAHRGLLIVYLSNPNKGDYHKKWCAHLDGSLHLNAKCLSDPFYTFALCLNVTLC